MTAGRWRMRGLFKRKGSEVWQGRFRIPQHLWGKRKNLFELGIEIGGSQGFSKSIGETDKAAATKKYRNMLNLWDVQLEGWESALTKGRVELTYKQAVALAGESAVSYLKSFEADPDKAPKPSKLLWILLETLKQFEHRYSPKENQEVYRLWQELDATPGPKLHLKIEQGLEIEEGARLEFVRMARGLLQAYDNAIARQSTEAVLDQHGIIPTKDSRASVVKHRTKLQGYAQHTLQNRMDFDYSVPDWEKNLPKFQESHGTKFSDLMALWEKEHKQGDGARSTVSEWKSIISRFSKFVGHQEASQVTTMDIHRYCDNQLETLSPATVKRKHLAAISSVFKVALNHQLLPTNPADGVVVKVPRRTKERSQAFTTDEAKRILNAASRRDKAFWGGMGKLNRLACQWIPWLCAYTGARAGEIAQLRKQDVQQEDGFYFIRITPDAGTVKSKQFRDVPLHPHLLELGFLEVVSNSNEGPLFYSKTLSRPEPWITPRDKVGKWVREKVGIKDKRIAPSHAWRHYFTHLAAEGGMDFNYRDAIRGHSNSSGASHYEEFPLAILYREICKLPRFEIA